MNPILITSMLDTDMYKLTMMQAMFHRYTSAHTKWRFKARRGNGFPESGVSNAEFLEALNMSLDHLCTLRYTQDDLEYIGSIRSKVGNPFFKDDFIDYLGMFQYNRKHVTVEVTADGSLDIVLNGPWLAVSGFEVPVLAIVSELHSMADMQGARIPQGRSNLRDKIDFLKAKEATGHPRMKFADFGTRRRYSFDWQENVLLELTTEIPHNLVGTSNLYFARQFGLTPIGTMAHEWFQAHQQLGGRLVDSQIAALDAWSQEYRGELGIALSDTYGNKAFLKDFDLFFAKLFDGCRHDSGDPAEWCSNLIDHYRRMGIDPKTKTAVFSDGLTFQSAYSLHYMFNAFINCSFGIGTNLMNDMGCEPISIVLKMVELNGKPVAKVSDSQGKGMCEDAEYESYVRKVFDIGGQAVYDSEPPAIDWVCGHCHMTGQAGTVNVGLPDHRECDICHRNEKCFEVVKR